jgi:hypothetical protein
VEAFEPPKYLTNLIAAVNDGAKSAQGAAFLFLLVGLYLLATAFSASDEDLLLGKTVTISQIGASLPVSFSFAIAPLVFVFLHGYALVRYDMLRIQCASISEGTACDGARWRPTATGFGSSQRSPPVGPRIPQARLDPVLPVSSDPWYLERDA